MADRLSADHPSVETIRATVVRRGGTTRPAISVPADAGGTPTADVIRLVLDGSEHRAPVSADGDGTWTILGAYESPTLARERGGTDHLSTWVDENGLDFGRSVQFDVVVEDVRYGVRAPGETTVYDASEPPSDGLQDIARDLEG